MRICYVASNIEVPCSDGNGSGGFTHTYEVATGLALKGHIVCLLCARAKSQARRSDLAGVRVYRVFNKHGLIYGAIRKYVLLWVIIKVFYYGLRYLNECTKLFVFLLLNRCNIIYERSSPATRLHSVIYRCLRLPMVLEVNDYYNSGSIAHAACIITPNKHVLPEKAQYKARELSWGANIGMFKPGIDAGILRNRYVLHEKKIAIMVSSGLAWHGLDDVLDAAGVVVKNVPNMVFIIVGGGINSASYEKRVDSLKLTNNVIFVGPVEYEDVPKYISLADMALAPYNSLLKKGFASRELFASPLKVFEYMACGKPVIITEIGNANNVIEHMKTGIVIQEDSPQAIADSILFLVNNSTFSIKLGMNARKIVVEKYSWRAHVDEVEKIFNLTLPFRGKI